MIGATNSSVRSMMILILLAFHPLHIILIRGDPEDECLLAGEEPGYILTQNNRRGRKRPDIDTIRGEDLLALSEGKLCICIEYNLKSFSSAGKTMFGIIDSPVSAEALDEILVGPAAKPGDLCADGPMQRQRGRYWKIFFDYRQRKFLSQGRSAWGGLSLTIA